MKQKKFRLLSLLLVIVLLFLFAHPVRAYAIDSNIGRLSFSKTYYIRNVTTGRYLTNPVIPNDQSAANMEYFSSPGNTRYHWKIVSADSGMYYIVPASNTTVGLHAASTNSIILRSISIGSSMTKWKIVMKDNGTYELYSCSSAFTDGTMILGNTTSNRFYLMGASGTSSTRWVFEEYLGTDRDYSATVTSYDYTYAGNGYASGHCANDVVSVGIYTLPVYSPYDGTATFWESKHTVNGVTYSTRIGNFVTVESTSYPTSGNSVLYAHLSSFSNIGWPASTATPSRNTSYEYYNPVKIHTKNTFRGEDLGQIGKSGSATGYHLHIEYFTDYASIWDSSNLKNTWIYASSYSSKVQHAHSYLKFWA